MSAPLRQALELLQEAEGQPRFLIASQDDVKLGVGIHLRIEETGPDALRRSAHAARQVPKGSLALGGFAFDPMQPPSQEWSAFPPSLFVVPALQWQWQDDEWLEHRNGSAARLPTLPEGNRGSILPQPDRKPLATQSRRHEAAPPEEEWNCGVDAALEAIRDGRLEKVVLARRVARPPIGQPLAAFASLAAAEPDAHAFYLEPYPGHAFFGASPERLVQLRDASLETHAVAGTAPRGSGATDVALGQRLLSAGKESHEHRLVVDHILDRLQGLGLTPEQGMRRLRRMASVQHLETRITAHASAGLHVLDVASALHPTPAVCGTPAEEARKFIAATEGTSRGWYAGGAGCFDAQGKGEILVALRAVLATPRGTWLHAGAGITEGSRADAEFAETEAKMHGMVEALAAPTARVATGRSPL